MSQRQMPVSNARGVDSMGYDRVVQAPQDGCEGTSSKYFRVLTGLVGLLALLWIVVELRLFHILENGVQAAWPTVVAMGRRAGIMDSVSLSSVVTAPAGWGVLIYACSIRSGRITGTALAFVLSVGVCGMAIFCYLVLGFPSDPFWVVILIGTWILYGLGIAWLVHKVRRIRAAWKIDAAESSGRAGSGG